MMVALEIQFEMGLLYFEVPGESTTETGTETLSLSTLIQYKWLHLYSVPCIL